MSYKNYKLALEKAKKCEGYFVNENSSSEVLNKAEVILDIKFSPQLKSFLTKFKYFSFYGNEFYGIIKDDFSGNYTPQLVVATLMDRKDYKMPHEYLHIWDSGDGAIGVLNYAELNAEGEPTVILVEYQGEDSGWVEIDRLADDLGDFLLQLVEEQLENQ